MPGRRSGALGLTLSEAQLRTGGAISYVRERFGGAAGDLAGTVGGRRQQMLNDMNDQLVSEASAQLDTRRVWVHAYRDADKIGGVTSTLAPMYTYADDWYIAAANEGPLHIGADGRPAPG